MVGGRAETRRMALERLTSLRLHQQSGRRSPHKPLLVLLALGRLATAGTSELHWSQAQPALADLLIDFGPPSKTDPVQGAAYPFTRLRSDGVWTLSRDAPMDRIGPLSTDGGVVGRFDLSLEQALRDDSALLRSVARTLVEAHFPLTVAPDVLTAVGLDPEDVLRAGGGVPDQGVRNRRRDPAWRAAILRAWNRQCAFCGYDGRLGAASVGVEAAHVRWFAFDGPDEPDNGLALCALHHKLFDRGVLGLDDSLRVRVAETFTAETPAGKTVLDLHGHQLRPGPGTVPPAEAHIDWHRRQVFRDAPVAA